MIFRLTCYLAKSMSVLHVAEKNSIAKQVANILSSQSKRSIPTLSKFNPIFEFQLDNKDHRFTSVRGHIFEYDLPQFCKSWKGFDNKKILQQQIGIIKILGHDMDDLVKNLDKLARKHQQLILWLDCDREGEAIAYEVIEICRKVNSKIKIKRARFSAVTPTDIWNAYNSLVEPNKLEADAVNYRIQIDFRSGCAFTRFQTVAFQSYFSVAKGVLSYGPCQMPTLSFVVERYLTIKNFKPEDFWFVSLECVIDDKTAIPFTWEKKNTRDQAQANSAIMRIVNGFPDGNVLAQVTNRKNSQKKKYRPYPLTTVKFQKLATDKLKLSSAKAMQIAEKLYQKGFISYPRTETNAFPKTMNLQNLLKRFQNSNDFGYYIKKLLGGQKYVSPKAGSGNDQAHTPIHPVKSVQKNDLQPIQWKVYQLIVRSFLACCSADAVGEEFEVKAQVGGQKFRASYLTIIQKNYLEIYPYEKWVQTSFPADIPSKFPALITLKQSKTTPPGYLTQSQLIDLMQKNQIGTDSTIHEHIQTIQKRQYAVKTNNTFKPTNLGASLIQTYKQLQISLPQCEIRRKIQEKMNKIANGQIQKESATTETLCQMLPIYVKLEGIQQTWIKTLKKYIQQNNDLKKVQMEQKDQNDIKNEQKKTLIPVCRCQKCSQGLGVVRFSQKSNKYFVGCSRFPSCNWIQSLPNYIQTITQTGQSCQKCEGGKLVQIKAKQNKVIQPFQIRIMFEQSQQGIIKLCLSPGCVHDFYQYSNDYSGPASNLQRNYSADNDSSRLGYTKQNFQNSRYAQNHNKSNNKYTNSNTNSDGGSLEKSNFQSRNQYKKKQITCYKCKKPGHYANNCREKQEFSTHTTPANFQNHRKYTKETQELRQGDKPEKKICPECGAEGRHPRGSSCPSVIRKRKNKQ